MKRLQLVWTAFALWAAACTAVTAEACEKNSGASASAVVASGSAACPSAMAAHCSAAQAAACKNAASAATAVTADAKCPVTAACPSAAASECSKHASAAAAAAGCPGMAGTTAHACPGMSNSAVTAGNTSQCKGGGLVKMADAVNHPDCDGCADMARCAQEIAAAGARVQVVPLKNGVMYVYTVQSSAGVRAVQAAVMQRNERLAALVTAGDHVKLCGRCKEMRGAAASGKLNREVVNIEGGCLTLMTSTDPVIVQRLHEMASASLVSVRTKS